MAVKALDLFCGAGGASIGLAEAGYEVTGVDLEDQPRYPFHFVKGDALDPPVDPREFDLVWASPPCQAHSALRNAPNAKPHPDLIGPTRERLIEWGRPWIIENVEGAPLRDPLMLCCTMFGVFTIHHGFYEMQRHRLFESSAEGLEAPGVCRHQYPVCGIYGGHVRDRRRKPDGTPYPDLRKEVGEYLMGVEQGVFTLAELSQMIPPRYSRHLAAQIKRRGELVQQTLF